MQVDSFGPMRRKNDAYMRADRDTEKETVLQHHGSAVRIPKILRYQDEVASDRRSQEMQSEERTWTGKQ